MVRCTSPTNPLLIRKDAVGSMDTTTSAHPEQPVVAHPSTPAAGAERARSADQTASARPPLPAALHVEVWPDAVVDKLGHDPRSHYVERYWLGVLGPSTTWLLRHVAERLDANPAGFDMPLEETAMRLGLGMRNGRHSPFVRAIERACQFGLARRVDTDTLLVRHRLPPVTQGQLRRLPTSVQRAHAAWRSAQLRDGAADAERKARRLALTLLELGEPVDAAERQLEQWRVDSVVAQQALTWAHNRHREAHLAAQPPGPDAA